MIVEGILLLLTVASPRLSAYLQTSDFNVIGVDWSVLCDVEYIAAMRGVQLAGEALASFIKWLYTMGIPMNNVHIVGHSLGAHVAGVAGDKFKDKKIGRITGENVHICVVSLKC